MKRVLIIVASSLAALLGVIFLVGGTSNLIRGSGHPELAGRGRLHDPMLEEERCTRVEGICARSYNLTLDKPDGQKETVESSALYAKVEVRGPQVVDVEWDSERHEASRLRAGGTWYRVAYPKTANVINSVAGIVAGLALVGFGGLFLLGALLPDADDQAEPELA